MLKIIHVFIAINVLLKQILMPSSDHINPGAAPQPPYKLVRLPFQLERNFSSDRYPFPKL
jgi:hypothetical protein